METTSLSRGDRAGLAAIAVLSAFSSLWRLSASSALPDEVVYVRAARSLLAGTGDPNLEHPPLAKFLFGLGQELTGMDLLGARLVAAAASLAIGVLLFVLVRRIAGTRAGMVAAGLWAVLPHVGGSSGPLSDAGRLDRFAMLDPVATALGLAAVTVGWSWLRRSRWQLALATGLLGGLAAAAKPTAVLVLPPIAVAVLWVRRDQWPRVGAGVAIAVLGSIAGFGLGYAPLGGEALEGLRFLVDFQSSRAVDGHVVTVAGTTTAFPPWWSHLWFAVRDDGWVLTLVLWGGALAAPFLVAGRTGDSASAASETPDRRTGTALLLAVVITTFVVLAIGPVKLPFYRYAWLPYQIGLTAISLDHGWVRVAGARRRRGRPPHVLLTLQAWIAVPALALTAVAAGHLGSIATLQPGGYRLVAAEIANTSGFIEPGYEPMLVRGRPMILDFHVQDLTFPGLEVVRTAELVDADAVLLDPDITSRFPDPADEVVDDPAWTCEAHDDLTLCRRGVATDGP